MFKRLFNFGYNIQIAKVSGVVVTQTNKILIATSLSIGLVGIYQLGNSVVFYAISISSLLASALIPAFTEVEARGEKDKLIDAYLRGTKYLAFFIVPLFIFLIASAGQIMTIWMGQGYKESSFTIQLLAMGFLINTIAQVAASTCIAIDRPQLMTRGSIVIIALNIILSVALIKIFGFLGAPLGTALAVNIGTLYFLIVLHKHLKISSANLIKITAPCLIACLFAVGAIFGVDTFISRFGLSMNRTAALFILFIRCLIFFPIYIAGALLGKFFNSEDINFLSKNFLYFNKISMAAGKRLI